MKKSEPFEIVIHENTTLFRPTLTKEQLRQWVDLVLSNPEYLEKIEDLAKLCKSINERVEREEKEKIEALEAEIKDENIPLQQKSIGNQLNLF